MTMTVLPGVGQAVEHVQQALDVGEVQAGGGLVQDVDGVAGGHPAQLLGQLDPLRLAAARGWWRSGRA